MCKKMSLINLSKILIKILELFEYKNKMHLCFGDANEQTVNSEFKKANMKLSIQIANGNEKLYTLQSQINVSQNSRQIIGNTHNGFQPFLCIMTEKLDTLVPIFVDIRLYPLL